MGGADEGSRLTRKSLLPLLLAWGCVGGEPESVPEVVLPAVYAEPPARLNDLAERMGGSEEIAAAILLESDRSGLPVDLIVGIIRTENPWLKADTVNWYGATGLMQVWDFHLGAYPQCGDDLTDIRTNICYGVTILEEKLEVAQGDTTLALLFYNGCWGLTYVLGCEDYPQIVAERGDD